MSFSDWVNLHSERLNKDNVSIPYDIMRIQMDPTEVKEVSLNPKHVKDWYHYYPLCVDKDMVYYININNNSSHLHKISRMRYNNDGSVSIKMNAISWSDTRAMFPRLYQAIMKNVRWNLNYNLGLR